VLSIDDLRPIYERNGRNAQRTADELGIAASTLKGWASYRELRSPFIVTGRSTLRDATGETVMVWEKESLDREIEERARDEAYQALAQSLPRELPAAAPSAVKDDLCNLYTFTDYHLGMLAWGEEGGDDWDVKIAERTLATGFEAMVAQSPQAHTAVINLQGDFLHTDGLIPETPGHKHVLDADSRYPKIVEVAIRAIRRLVGFALERHSEVRLIIAEGNHDESGSVWLRQMFAALYDMEPRVSVDTAALPFYTFLWGETFLGFHQRSASFRTAFRLRIAASITCFRCATGRLQLPQVRPSGEIQPREGRRSYQCNGAPISFTRLPERRSIAPAPAFAIGSTSCSCSRRRGTALPPSASSASLASPTKPRGACATKSASTWPRSTATILWAALARRRNRRNAVGGVVRGKGRARTREQDDRSRDAGKGRRADYARRSEPPRNTLRPVIQKHVLPGTTIHTDELAATAAFRERLSARQSEPRRGRVCRPDGRTVNHD
jgi:hypothetical protein